MARTGWLACLAAVAVVCTPASVAADIVKFTNGRTMTIDSCRFDGDTAVLVLRGGGEIRMGKALIDELLPDEFPYASTAAIEALAASPAANGPQLTANALRIAIDRAAAKWGIDKRLAHALIRVESNYNPLAISRKGAMGLMQLMPATAQQYGVRDPFDPLENLEAGMRHLRYLMDRFDPRRAIAAYNAGEGAVRRYGAVPPYRETQNYVQRILAIFQGG
ncbi:MAG TPA: lytic transglycosylase domain-containing protein [Vicinamibacterales bacterium]|nr:lytic transglycosylase domain-containing protein [Vicinamibacterales bacterium]